MPTHKEIQKIVNFKKSQHYRDICYMIDHVKNRDICLNCLEDLNYRIGTNLIMSKKESKIKSVNLGKNGEYRVQVTPFKNNFATFAIYDPKKHTKSNTNNKK